LHFIETKQMKICLVILDASPLPTCLPKRKLKSTLFSAILLVLYIVVKNPHFLQKPAMTHAAASLSQRSKAYGASTEPTCKKQSHAPAASAAQ
jgi:hypothetical protein